MTDPRTLYFLETSLKPWLLFGKVSRGSLRPVSLMK